MKTKQFKFTCCCGKMHVLHFNIVGSDDVCEEKLDLEVI